MPSSDVIPMINGTIAILQRATIQRSWSNEQEVYNLDNSLISDSYEEAPQRIDSSTCKGNGSSNLMKTASVIRQSSGRSSSSIKCAYAPAEITRLIDSSDR